MADKVLRCAVYTRKSTEDGLEQEFNSLDAQYEACVAYAMARQSGSESPSIRIRTRDRDVAVVFF